MLWMRRHWIYFWIEKYIKCFLKLEQLEKELAQVNNEIKKVSTQGDITENLEDKSGIYVICHFSNDLGENNKLK